ncbi:MAG: hypothetical protein PHF72_04320 [Gammaproteobacteria bacterium]|nr:hypothetical protein [Gammaproteobacteria bacterium]
MIVPSPDQLVEAGAGVLARFGYRPNLGGEEDWAEMWLLLRGDFATHGRPAVPAYPELRPSQQEAARVYMRRRLIADRLWEECRKAQAGLYGRIDTEAVARYSIAREAYEESVEDFGRAREQVEAML